MKRAVGILINSKTKDSYPAIESPETWDECARVVLVDDGGIEEWQYISTEEIVKMKTEEADSILCSYSRVKSLKQFLEEKFGRVFVAHYDAVPISLNDYLDEIKENNNKKTK